MLGLPDGHRFITPETNIRELDEAKPFKESESENSKLKKGLADKLLEVESMRSVF